MRKPRKRQTLEENVNYFCKRNKLNLTNEQKNTIKECYLKYGNNFSSKSKLNQYLKFFIKYNLKFWKQRLNRLLKINLKAVTKKKMLLLYGKNETKIRWEKYIEMQAKSNTYEYKKDKYGWSEEDFLKYNKSRSITLDNMVDKYGEIVGKEKYENYVEKQRYSGCSIEYFVEKYGEVQGVKKYYDLCKRKSLTITNFILKYGEILGRKKYRDYINRTKNFYSKSSQELFWKIKTNKCYFAEYNKEFGLISETNYYFYDFVDIELKKCIEYNGDYWHLNPKFYSKTYKTHYGYTAEEVWEKDKKKIDFIKSKGYDVMIVWESEYLNNPNCVIKKIEEFLYD